MNLDWVYRLVEGVQVRNESFGLLFYDYRGPRLYFVPAKHLISDAFFEGKESVADVLDRLAKKMPWPRDRIQTRLRQVLEALERKGLVHGQPIC